MKDQVGDGYWKDHNGMVWLYPITSWRLNFRKSGHAALRAFVFHRDGYRCRECGIPSKTVPEPYTGRYTLNTIDDRPFHLDHVIPFVAGGRHQIENLQMLCESCNARKCGKVFQ